MKEKSIYEISVNNIHHETIPLSIYKGKVLLIVNVASQCGFTKQYSGLQYLYSKYKVQGFEILGFPCNQFGGQEPEVEEEIYKFCDLNYGVEFPLFEKIQVNGEDAHPLYKYLKNQSKGLLGTEMIKWNFTKFLVDREGKVIKRYAPATTPESLEVEIESILVNEN